MKTDEYRIRLVYFLFSFTIYVSNLLKWPHCHPYKSYGNQKILRFPIGLCLLLFLVVFFFLFGFLAPIIIVPIIYRLIARVIYYKSTENLLLWFFGSILCYVLSRSKENSCSHSNPIFKDLNKKKMYLFHKIRCDLNRGAHTINGGN